MLRFHKNRWWTLILALSLCFASYASRPNPAMADGPNEIQNGTPGPGDGDPDMPTTPGKQSRAGRGALKPSGRQDPWRSVGDGRQPVRVVMWRLYIMGLRGFWLHF